MDGMRRFGPLGTFVLLGLSAAGCANDGTRRPIKPFGSVHTYSSTVSPGPQGRPRGQMVRPPALGIDLVRRPAPMASTPAGLMPRDLSAIPAVATSPISDSR
jgi:hypothetical protein